MVTGDNTIIWWREGKKAVESRGASSRIHKAPITDNAETNAIKGLNNDARASIVIV